MGVLKVKVGGAWSPIGYYQPFDSGQFVLKTGDVMTGSLTVNGAGTGFVISGGHPQYGSGYASIYRADQAGLGQYTVMATPSALLLNCASGGVSLRVNNTDVASFTPTVATVVAQFTVNSTLNITGSNVLYFSTYGGGWQMTDSTWIRSYNSKNVYVSTLMGCAQLSVGLGGALTSGYAIDNGGQSYLRGMVQSNALIQSVKAGNPNWSAAHLLAYATTDYADIAFYQATGGAAPQLRNHSSDGYAIGFMNSDQSGWSNAKAYAFVVQSTMTMKHDIRSLSPDMEPRPAYVPWNQDVIDQANIMALRPAVYRRNDLPQIVVPRSGYDRVAAEDDDSWEIIESTNPVMQVDYKREQLGLIAEEVAMVLPTAVQFDCNTGNPAGINYVPIIVAMLDHVQRLTRHVETLQYRITELEAS